jgi:hypothetical protein
VKHLTFAALFLAGCCLGACKAPAQESWTEALAQTRLPAATHELGDSNCVEIMLGAFRSNRTVKALIFMPGATDEFYMFHRAHARLTNAAPSLLDGIMALTNQSRIRVTFQAPLLLLHTQEDPLTPDITIRDPATAEKLKRRVTGLQLLFLDRDWDAVQPVLKWSSKTDLRPWRHSKDSWHFYRHSFRAFGLTGWEAFEAAALAGKSRFVVGANRVTFEPDPRFQATPPGGRGARAGP